MGRKLTTKELLRHWAFHPDDWVCAYFGDNIRKASGLQTKTGLSTQQEHGLRELGKLIEAKWKAHKGEVLTEQEREYSLKLGLSVMSGKGTGKDFFAAICDRFFQSVFPNAKNLCTANTAQQLKNVLWSEIAKVMEMSVPVDTKKPVGPDNPPKLQYLFTWNNDKIYCKAKEGKRWFTEAATVSVNATEKQQSATLGGRHEDFMLVVIDEASGIPEPVFRGIEGTLTGKVNLILMIFNPTRSSGFAIDSQYSDRSRWVCLRWNSEESDLVSRQQIQTMQDKYDRDDAPYRIDVLGLPPIADSNTLIPMDWIQDAIDRPIEGIGDEALLMSLDCGAGGDKSVIGFRKGPKVYPFKKNSTPDSNDLEDWAAMNFMDSGADALFGDVVGIGWHIMGRLRKRLPGKAIRSVDSRGKAGNDERYANKRAENYMNLRTAFQNKSISIPNDSELISQLAVIKKDEDLKGRTIIVKKSKIKAEIGHSPDEADTLSMLYSASDDTYKAVKEDDEERRERLREERRARMQEAYQPYSWMGA